MHIMPCKAFRLLLSAILLAGLAGAAHPALAAPPIGPVRGPSSPFTDVGGLGLPALYNGDVAWGDYDLDGDLDVALSGDTGPALVTAVYRNDGGTFVDIGAGLAPCAGPVAWGDYDSDGDLDLAAGCHNRTRIYRNDGGAWVDAGVALPGTLRGAIVWGDYDNDGDLDLLLMGDSYPDDPSLPSGEIAEVYRNDGGAFTRLPAGLQGVNSGEVAWGDYDNDGDLDILLTGSHTVNWVGMPVTRLYRNDGSGFVDTGAGLLDVFHGAVAWGDYDSDGDLDILLTGRSRSGSTLTPEARLYRNDGGTFVDTNAALPGIQFSDVAWGDYDNDGDLDILLSGETTRTVIAAVYRNDGGTFTDIRARLIGVDDAALAWGDYDNDGDLDILLIGSDGGAGRTVHVYRNESTVPNTPPTAPGTLGATVNGPVVDLAWSAAGDTRTPASGLTYNLRVGRTPGGVDVVSPLANPATGWRRVPALGNANHGTTARLNLPPGTYYWSVQAVDTAFAGGAFGPEASFAVASPPQQATVEGPTTGALGAALAFTACVTPPETTLPLTYAWLATGQEPLTHEGIASLTDTATFSWNSPGPQTITVTVANAAGSALATHALTIYAAPQADFSGAPTSGVAPLTVAFTNTTSGVYTASWWDFGDAITSTLPSPTHTYALPGVYTVTLTVEGPGGTDTRVVTDCITAEPALPEPGPLRTDLVLANLGASAAAVNLAYTPGESGGVTRRHDLGRRIPPHGGQRLPSSELAPAASSPWTGSGLVLTTQPLATLAELLWDYPAGPQTAAAYAGEAGPGTAAYLPLLAAGPGRLTLITLHNTETAGASATLRIYDRHGTPQLVQMAAIPPHAERTFSLADLAPDLSATEGYGTAWVTATCGIAVVARLHWVTASEAYRAATEGDTALWLPGLSRRALEGGAWDYGEVIVQNAGPLTATVHAEFLNPDGSLAYALDDAIPPQGAAAYNTCERGTLSQAAWQALVAALGDNWQGTVRLTSTNGQPLVGVAVGWVASAGVADNLAYSAPPGSTPGQALAFPAVQRQLAGGAGDRWSATLIHNTASVPGMLTVEFFDQDGVRVGIAYAVPVPGYGQVRLDLKDGADLPPTALAALGGDFSGSMIVAPSPGVAIDAVNQLYWPSQGRAAAYTGFPLP